MYKQSEVEPKLTFVRRRDRVEQDRERDNDRSIRVAIRSKSASEYLRESEDE